MVGMDEERTWSTMLEMSSSRMHPMPISSLSSLTGQPAIERWGEDMLTKSYREHVEQEVEEARVCCF